MINFYPLILQILLFYFIGFLHQKNIQKYVCGWKNSRMDQVKLVEDNL